MTSFHAYDKKGKELQVEKASLNRWKIAKPSKVAKLVYTLEDSFDSEVEGGRVSPMSGTGIDSNFVLLNTFGVLEFFEGMQSEPVKLAIDYNPGWMVGTALQPDGEGYYYAETYDRLVDSPFLIGELSVDSTFYL